MENNKYVPIALVVVGVLIAGAIYFRPATPPATNTQPNSQEEAAKQAKARLAKMDPVSSTEHLLGSTQAPIKIVEYSDLECPFCKAFHLATKSLSDKYLPDNKVAIAFRQFPLNIHSKAPTEAAAAECAATLGDNNKFWQYLDKVFAVTPSNNGLDLALLPKMAGELGIDQAKFNACLNDAKTKSLVDAQVKKGLELGVDGTPFVVVIGPKGERVLPFYEAIPTDWSAENKQIITDLLNNYDTEINKLRNAQ